MFAFITRKIRSDVNNNCEDRSRHPFRRVLVDACKKNAYKYKRTRTRVQTNTHVQNDTHTHQDSPTLPVGIRVHITHSDTEFFFFSNNTARAYVISDFTRSLRITIISVRQRVRVQNRRLLLLLLYYYTPVCDMKLEQ